MDQKAIIQFCKNLSCCDACCLRYAAFRSHRAFEDASKFILQYIKVPSPVATDDKDRPSSPPAKRRKADTCVSCLGILQEDTWPQSWEMAKEMMERKRYECTTFACALSAPIATILREKAVTLKLREEFTDYEANNVTALKEAWKWSFGSRLAGHIDKTLDSGSVSPLLITLNMEYPDDLQELEILKTLSPELFESRSKQRRRFTVEFTRRSVEQALDGVTLPALQRLRGWESVPAVGAPARCVSVVCTHSPVYLGGRYVKLSRSLPQTPWLVQGRRMMESSVQEIIFQPIADAYGIPHADMNHRLKFISSGREDVDVRCLGGGRPFAVEVSDPHRELSDVELAGVCAHVSSGGMVRVKEMIPVTREDLTQLKKGEETKSKTYEALCIKLSHSHTDDVTANGDSPIAVTQQDLDRINRYRNTPAEHPARVVIQQKTPIRVLHRRPLLTRTRSILQLSAEAVQGHPQLFRVVLCTAAGTYVKEWAHGELGRTRPALRDALGADVDILALDVADVDLCWPTRT